MSKPLTRDRLEAMPCGTPGCDHTAHDEPMVLHPRCCPGHGLLGLYKDGVLELRCNRCDAHVCNIAVSSAEAAS